MYKGVGCWLCVCGWGYTLLRPLHPRLPLQLHPGGLGVSTTAQGDTQGTEVPLKRAGTKLTGILKKQKSGAASVSGV